MNLLKEQTRANNLWGGSHARNIRATNCRQDVQIGWTLTDNLNRIQHVQQDSNTESMGRLHSSVNSMLAVLRQLHGHTSKMLALLKSKSTHSSEAKRCG